MKAYALDLRERVVKFIQGGGSKAEAARRFDLARSSVYRYLVAAQKGALTPKKSWGHWRKLDPQKLQSHVKKHPDATLKELQQVFGVSHHALWVRLGQLGFTLKKTGSSTFVMGKKKGMVFSGEVYDSRKNVSTDFGAGRSLAGDAHGLS